MEFPYRGEMSLRYSYSTMSKPLIFVSATIVLFLQWTPIARANPPKEMPKEDANVESTWPTEKLDDNLVISEPPPLEHEPKPNPRYYPYRQQLTFRYGRIDKYPNTDFEDLLIGFQYIFPKFLSPKLEAGADLMEEAKGHLNIGWRKIYSERSYFRPSIKGGISCQVDGREMLVTFANPGNYYARGSAALEYVVWNPWSIRLEPEVMMSVQNMKWIVTLGLSRGW